MQENNEEMLNNQEKIRKRAVKLHLTTHQYRALYLALQRKNETIEGCVNTYILQIYEKNVPKETREFLIMMGQSRLGNKIKQLDETTDHEHTEWDSKLT